MNKVFATLSLMVLFLSQVVMAQGFGGSSVARDDEYPVPQPTATVEVPVPADFGQEDDDSEDNSEDDD